MLYGPPKTKQKKCFAIMHLIFFMWQNNLELLFVELL